MLEISQMNDQLQGGINGFARFNSYGLSATIKVYHVKAIGEIAASSQILGPSGD